MENPYNDATENINTPRVASVNENFSLEAIHSEAAENLELSDAISTGSSFEILSMKEDFGETQENTDELDSNPSILGNCDADDTNSVESYRAEITKKFVMESEYEFVEDGESNISDCFVTDSSVDVKHDVPSEHSDEPYFAGPASLEHPLLADFLEPDRHDDITEQLRVPEIKLTDEDLQTENDSVMDVVAQVEVPEELRVAARSNTKDIVEDSIPNSEKENNQDSDQDKERSSVVQRIESDPLEEPEEDGIDCDVANDRFHSCIAYKLFVFILWLRKHYLQSQQKCKLCQWISRFSFANARPIFLCLVLLAFRFFVCMRNPGESYSCTYKDIDENFKLAQRNESSFPRCLEHSVAAKELYQMATTVHDHQMTYLKFRNASLSYEVSRLSKANQVLEKSLADMKTQFSEQLVKNKELEHRVMELMSRLDPHSSSHPERMIRHTPTEAPVMFDDDDWDWLNRPSSQNKRKSPDVNEMFIHLTKMIKDLRNTTLKPEQGGHDHKTAEQKPPLVFQTFLQLFVKTSANVSDKNFPDQLTVFENSFDVIGQCVNHLQTLMPSKTVYYILSIDWLKVQEIISQEASKKDEALSKGGSNWTLEPCHVFMSKADRNSLTGLSNYGKKKLQDYINKTLDAVDKIGQTVRSTLEAIKTLPDNFFNNGDLFSSFGNRFKKTFQSMNKQFNKGFNKLKEKVNRKFKSSLSALSKGMRAGWDKINKRSNSGETLLSRAKNRFWKRGAKQSEKSSEPVPDTAVDNSVKLDDNVEEGVKPEEKIRPSEGGDVEINELKFHSQSEMSKDEPGFQMHRLESLLDDSDWLDEYRLIREMSAIRSESMAPLVKVSFDILKLTPSEYNFLDPVEREDYWTRLSVISVAGSDISRWTKNWLNCQKRWWHKQIFGNSAPRLEEPVTSCGPWLVKWQSEVQDGLDKRQKSEPLDESRPLADKMNVDGYCMREEGCSDHKRNDDGNTEQAKTSPSPESMNAKNPRNQNGKTKYHEDNRMSFNPDGERDSRWYFRQSDRDFSDSDWYFEMMQDRENGRHDSKWYFKDKLGASRRHQKPALKGYRGR